MQSTGQFNLPFLESRLREMPDSAVYSIATELFAILNAFETETLLKSLMNQRRSPLVDGVLEGYVSYVSRASPATAIHLIFSDYWPRIGANAQRDVGYNAFLRGEIEVVAEILSSSSTRGFYLALGLKKAMADNIQSKADIAAVYETLSKKVERSAIDTVILSALEDTLWDVLGNSGESVASLGELFDTDSQGRYYRLVGRTGDVESLRALILDNHDGILSDADLDTVTTQMALRSPESTTTWMSENGFERLAVVSFERWLDTDSIRAGEWASSRSQGRFRDLLISEVVFHLREEKAFQQASEWAHAISDQLLRESLVGTIPE